MWTIKRGAESRGLVYGPHCRTPAPLYSIAVDQAVGAVVFGRVRKGDAKYLGVAAEEAIVSGAAWPGAKKSPVENFLNFSEVLRLWQEKIEILAQEVRQGVATVSPVSLNTSCRYCDLSPICRIKDANFLEGGQA